MKKYINPATEAVELQGERMMVEVNQSGSYGGEVNAPGRADGSSYSPAV